MLASNLNDKQKGQQEEKQKEVTRRDIKRKLRVSQVRACTNPTGAQIPLADSLQCGPSACLTLWMTLCDSEVRSKETNNHVGPALLFYITFYWGKVTML